MSLIEAIILGIIQGLTEFLPVSSSGHLELANAIIDGELDPEQNLLFTIILHAATAFSTIVIFWKDIVEIVKSLLSFKWNEQTKFSLKIIISMIPAALVGLFFEKEIDAFFGGRIVLVGSMLLVTGALLFFADRAKNTTKKVSFSNAFIVGVSQAIAILPGISRSGATISTSVLLGVDRSKAARFSFLMVVPLILGAMTVKMKDYSDIQVFNELNAQARLEMSLDDINEDRPINEEERLELSQIISGKEVAWEKIKESSDSKEIGLGIKQLKLNYKSTIEDSELSADLKIILEESDLSRVRSISSHSISSLIAGFLAAFLTGLFACKWMISLVKKSKLIYFSIYCFAVGLIAIGVGLF